MTERQRPYYICDGCGYEVNPNSEHGMLTLQFRPRHQTGIAAVKHFHAPRNTDIGGPRGKPALQDCLDYWWHNRKSRELTEGKPW